MFKDIKKQRSVAAPNRVCLKSPQFYLELITRIHPAWGKALSGKHINQTRVWVALWAAAVAVANACRISEVLRILGRQMLPNGMAVAVGSKGSSARMIYTGLLASESEYLRTECAMRPVFCVGYREVWGAVVGNGLAVQEAGHEHQSVTHSGRYMVVQAVAPFLGEEVAGEAIGHKSSRSARYYAHPEQCANDRATKRRIRKREEAFMQGPQLPSFLEVDDV